MVYILDHGGDALPKIKFSLINSLYTIFSTVYTLVLNTLFTVYIAIFPQLTKITL